MAKQNYRCAGCGIRTDPGECWELDLSWRVVGKNLQTSGKMLSEWVVAELSIRSLEQCYTAVVSSACTLVRTIHRGAFSSGRSQSWWRQRAASPSFGGYFRC